MNFRVSPIDSDGNVLEAEPGSFPPGCIGGVVQKEGGGRFVAVPVMEDDRVVSGNLGAYGTFDQAVAALLSNHRREWAREERRLHPGGW